MIRTSRRTVFCIALLGVLALALAACGKKSSPTAPGPPTGTQADLQALLASSFFADLVLPDTLTADSSKALLATMNVGGVRAAAALFQGATGLVSADSVTVSVDSPPVSRVVSLDAFQLVINGFTQTVYNTLRNHPLGINLPFDGIGYHRFDVVGGGGFTAFSDSVQSVEEISVTLPANAATVPRTAPLTITWPSMGDLNVRVKALVTSLVDTTKFATSVAIRDDAGAVVIPDTSMNKLPVGSAKLVLSRFRIRYHGSGSTKVAIVTEAAVAQSLTLN